MKARKRTNISERFWVKVSKGSESECWLWKGSRNNKGYGMVFISRGTSPALAHRISWELTNGLIGDGLCVLHMCDNPQCVNPHHLFLGTISDNAKDMIDKGRSKTAYTVENNKKSQKTHCPHGHPYSGDNLYVRKDTGYRMCLTCTKERKNLLYKRKKELGNA